LRVLTDARTDAALDTEAMTLDDRSKLHDATNRERFALRRAVRLMAAEQREFERDLEVFDEHVDGTKHRIEADLREVHWGHEPERRPSWQGGRLPARSRPR
jgi:hypothetical protein